MRVPSSHENKAKKISLLFWQGIITVNQIHGKSGFIRRDARRKRIHGDFLSFVGEMMQVGFNGVVVVVGDDLDLSARLDGQSRKKKEEEEERKNASDDDDDAILLCFA